VNRADWRRRAWVAAATLAAAGALAPRSGRAQQAPAAPREVATILRLDGPIDALTERSLELRIERALAKGPRFLILSIDSPGGEVHASRTIAWNLVNLEQVTTIAYVRGQALSGATLVAFGCDAIAMAPRGQLGDALPIYLKQALDGLEVEVARKMIAPVRKDLQDLADRRGYSSDIAAAMVDPDVELRRVEARDPATGAVRERWIDAAALSDLPFELRTALVTNEVACPSGDLLVVGASDALRMGLSLLEAPSEDELCRELAREFSTGELLLDRAPDLWWESAVRVVTWTPVKMLLFAVGTIALLVALSTPGTGPPEAVAAVCFGAFFFGSYLMGLADWIEVILFAAGLALLAVELLVTPGFGVAGVAGILAVGAALLLSFQSFVWPTNPLEWEQAGESLLKTVTAGALSLVGLVAAARHLPRSGLLGGLIHDHTQPAVPTGHREHELAPVGATCVAATPLRPVGKVEAGGELLDAVAEGDLIEAGAAVVVVAHRGRELVVALGPAATALEPGEGAEPEPERPPADRAGAEEEGP